MARLQNDPDVKPTLELGGILSGVSAENIPAASRQGEKIRGMYMKVRPLFNVADRKWDRNGQNDPDPLVFEKFVALDPDSIGVCYDGKRTVILFDALSCIYEKIQTIMRGFN